ncbi:MAG TPA: chemotaxis protein CheX [Polyangiaceae bacterium]|jgi:hypothetical protein|nr:chemotaxis protein CheX [Polyangiaceae bacterium]
MNTLAEQAGYFLEIQDYLVAGVEGLFLDYGLPVSHSMGAGAVNVSAQSAMAVVGYAAPTMRGALLLMSSRGLIEGLQPAAIRIVSPSDASLCDILGEFANMLAGRIKNRLVARNVAPLLSTPAAMIGDKLSFPAPTGGMSAWHHFGSEAGTIYVRLDTTFDKDFALSDQSPALGEGEMVLFSETQ